MEKILLRTMTRKSKLKDGKYDGLTVESMLSSSQGKSYLRYLYFSIQNINFVDDILDEIGIRGKWIIKKPGVDKQAFIDWNAKLGDVFGATAFKKKDAKALMHLKEQSYQKRARILKAFQNTNFTKAYLQGKNQGR